MIARLSMQDAEDLIRHCRVEGSIIVGRHFREEMGKEGLILEDVWEVLRTGHIYSEPEHDIRSGEWKYRLEGYEKGGKWMVIVFSFKAIDRAFLITIFSVKSARRT